MPQDKDYLKMVESGPASWSALPALMRQIKDNAVTVLLKSLDDLFSGCDDLFFDLSSRATSNNEQTLYFESMRELRIKRHGVINTFVQNVERSFLALAGGQKKAVEPAHATHNDALALVQNDDLERDVAISGMIGKARVNNQEALYQLVNRFDYLLSPRTVSENNNPLDPQQLCQAFALACDLFDINIKARIIIYKQFERHVVSRLGAVYAAANDLMVNAGVLPKVPARISKQDSSPAAPTSASPAANVPDSAPAANAPVEDYVGLAYSLIELSNLLAQIRQTDLHTMPGYSRYTANPGPAMSNAELLGILSLLQTELDSEQLMSNSLRQIVDQALRSNNPVQPQALVQPDEDVINLVAMFFDFVLDDAAIPVPVQALIARLQIPILKTALRDKDFFSAATHPARRLVNAIAAASVGIDETRALTDDKLYGKINQVVRQVLEHYIDNNAVFVEQLAELTAFLEQENRKASLVEKRTGQALEGQAKTTLARETAQAVMLDKLRRSKLPPAVNEFLVNQWLQLLVIVHLRHGEESADWLDAVQLVDDVIWACRQHDDMKSQERLAKIKPSLLARIEAGLPTVVNTAEECSAIVRTVDRTIAALQVFDNAVPLEPLTAMQVMALGHTPGSGSKSWKDMTALERQQAKYKALTYEFIKKVEGLPLGTWLNYNTSGSSKPLRCKLAARIQSSDTYVFVNRLGFKVLERDRKAFAYDLQQTNAVLLESGLLFDRAMSNIIGRLRKPSG